MASQSPDDVSIDHSDKIAMRRNQKIVAVNEFHRA